MKMIHLPALYAFLAVSSAHAASPTAATPPPVLAPIPVVGFVMTIDIPNKDFTLREGSGRVSRYSLGRKARVTPSTRGMPGAASLEGIRVNDRCSVIAQDEDGIQVTYDVDCNLR